MARHSHTTHLKESPDGPLYFGEYMAFPIATLITGIGSALSGFFGLKGKHIETVGGSVNEAIKLLNDANSSASEKEKAIAAIITAESTSSAWITRAWRPLTMVSFVLLIYMFFFGYTPPNVTPQIIDRIFDLITIGISGYIPARTIEKIITQINVGAILKKFLN